MLFIRRFMLAAALALAACGAPQQDAGDPVAIVQPLYEAYLSEAPPPALLDYDVWTPELRALLERASAPGEEPILDFDPIIDAQDYQITAIAVTLVAPPADGRALVRARFNNLGEDRTVTYDMRQTPEGWRIDNISGATWDLRSLFAEYGLE